MITTVEEAVVVATVLAGLGGLWAFAIGGMVGLAWEATFEPLRERYRSRKG